MVLLGTQVKNGLVPFPLDVYPLLQVHVVVCNTCVWVGPQLPFVMVAGRLAQFVVRGQSYQSVKGIIKEYTRSVFLLELCEFISI